jgi:abhydrolase domain-containing protein 14
MVSPKQIQSSRTLGRLPVYLAAAGGILVVFLLLMLSSEPEVSNHQGIKESTEMIQDSVGAVEYYHCPAADAAGGDDAYESLDLILLHGASFTKENWKSSGILDKLCQVPKLSVTALDLDRRANHDDLKNALDSLRNNKIIRNNKPVALVTPSASGYTIVDWISTGSIESLVKYVGYWIPVASPSISRAEDVAIQGLKNRLKILAIYGSKDKNGKVVSEKLHTLANAKLVQIEGSHPCYLDSPDDFIRELLDFLP